ncbi:MAG: HD-GYP domain-containing protein [Bacteriovoracia bacterium]
MAKRKASKNTAVLKLVPKVNLPNGDEETLSYIVSILNENAKLKTSFERLYQQTIHALMRCLEERDAYTYGHCMRVMEYGLMIGRAADLSDSQLKSLELTAMFHDIGKIGIPDCVLLKPGKLDKSEVESIKTHSLKGFEILSLIDELKPIAKGVRHHHERIDGMGYPDSLSGDQIPLISRIILVADTFDAMTSTRPYRRGLPFEVAYDELSRYAGAQFDEKYVKIFLEEHQKLSTPIRKTIKKAA